MRRKQRDWMQVSVLAFDGNNIIAGVIGGRRNGEFQYFSSSTYASALTHTPHEFKEPVRVSENRPAPDHLTFQRTESQGMLVEAGYDKITETWYLKETTGIQSAPRSHA